MIDIHDPVTHLARCYPQLAFSADYKTQFADFQVKELLGFDLTGEGEHLWVYIEKTNLTTQQLIEAIANIIAVPARQIGYAGLKDKQGITQQWLSLPLAQTSLSEELVRESLLAGHDQFRLLNVRRHQKKCRIGCHSGNAFELRLRQAENVKYAEVAERIGLIGQRGFPNYFTEQRFGFDNLSRLLSFSASRKRRKIPSMLLSAGRAYLFNLLLSHVINQGELAATSPGDVLLLSGSNSFFSAEESELDALAERLARHDIVKALPMLGADLWSVYASHSALSAAESQAIGDKVSQFADKSHYRPTIVVPQQLDIEQIEQAVLQLRFALPKGAYATALLRELGHLNDGSRIA